MFALIVIAMAGMLAEQVVDGRDSRSSSHLMMTLARVDTGKDEGNFYPVKLVCPKGNGGRLELFTMAEDGKAMKYFLEYREGRPHHVGYQLSEGGSGFRPFKDLLITEVDSPAKKKLFDFWVKKGESWVNEVCDASEKERDRYLRELKRNLEFIQKTKP